MSSTSLSSAVVAVGAHAPRPDPEAAGAGNSGATLARAMTVGVMRPRAISNIRRVDVRPAMSPTRVQSWSAGVGAGIATRAARTPRSTRVTPVSTSPHRADATRAGGGSPGAAPGYRAYRGVRGSSKGPGARAVRRLIRRGTHQVSALVLLPDEVLAHVMAYCTGRELHRLKLSCRSMYAQVESVAAYHDWRADKIVALNRSINLSTAQRARIQTMPEQSLFLSFRFSNSPGAPRGSTVDKMLDMVELHAAEASTDYARLPNADSKLALSRRFAKRISQAREAHFSAMREFRRRVVVTWIFRAAVLFWFCTVCRVGFSPIAQDASDAMSPPVGDSGSLEDATEQCVARALALSIALPLVAASLFLAAAFTCGHRVRFQVTLAGRCSCSSRGSNAAIVWLVSTLVCAALAFRNCAPGCWVCADHHMQQDGVLRAVMVYVLSRPMAALFTGVCTALIAYTASLALFPRLGDPPAGGLTCFGVASAPPHMSRPRSLRRRLVSMAGASASIRARRSSANADLNGGSSVSSVGDDSDTSESDLDDEAAAVARREAAPVSQDSQLASHLTIRAWL